MDLHHLHLPAAATITTAILVAITITYAPPHHLLLITAFISSSSPCCHATTTSTNIIATPHHHHRQNGIAERKNRTLIEVARTLLADSLLPIHFWAEAVNTACYVQNKVLVTKPHNKTPYELLHARLPSIGFMRPFGCYVTILNTLDPLGKFQGKVDEGFLVRYSVCSKAFRVFNSRTRIVQETLHVNFMENKPNVVGSGPAWLFDIDRFKDLNEEFAECINNSSNGVNAVGSLVFAAGLNFTNSTNDFSAAGPSNA
nr:retrovirus-related Pol polyprotein from transposon TNT 1-94 [Tanacetum cinerariifolium]